MEVTRIFVSGLPPSLTNDGLRKHFSSRYEVTDAHVIPNRRIGFVGFKSNTAAQDAAKYFNKSYIRMSKIAVELARPVDADPVDTRSRMKGASDRKPTNSENRNKRKRDPKDQGGDDPKFQEFLTVMQPSSKAKIWADSALEPSGGTVSAVSGKSNDVVAAAAEPVVEAQKKNKRLKFEKKAATQSATSAEPDTSTDPNPTEQTESGPQRVLEVEEAPQSDTDWLRSKTSRLLGLIDEEEETEARSRPVASAFSPIVEDDAKHGEAPQVDGTDGSSSEEDEEKKIPNPNIESIRGTGRLFVRNLPYDATESDLEPIFAPFGKTEEVHVAFDTRRSTSKGFAYVQYFDPEAAVQAYKELDGKDFQGRLLHILPASAKKTYKLDEVELSKLPHKKQQQIKRKAEAGTSTWSWNSLYMNADAVMSSVAERLGVYKSDILDPTSSDAAVKQAHAETHVIQETKAYFAANGVNLDSFKQRERGNTAILVKNFSYGVKAEELRELFKPYGQITRLLMPPSGTIAIVEFAMPDEAQKAFKGLAYRKLGDSILFLEKAPKDLFQGPPTATTTIATPRVVSQRFSTSDTFKTDEVEAPVNSSTLFIRNLNFSTTDSGLASVFEPLEGFLSAKVKTKANPKRPGERLSMGFGFVEFRTRAQAQAALAAMNGYNLDNHELVIKASHKGADAAEQQRREDNAKKLAGRRTKIIIKNLPFQTTKKDIRSLFGAYGQLRSVRVPQKFDRTARGFAFADFTSAREAENAMDALKNTHLLGRRLVLEFASEEAIDAEEEIRKMEKKVDAQVNKVKLKQLTGQGRKKFHVDAVDDE